MIMKLILILITIVYIMEITLANAVKGIPMVVTKLQSDHYYLKRLQALGFLVGEKVEVLTKSKLGQAPIIVRIGRSRFALRYSEALQINVRLAA